jgi:hypothetical protein
MRHQLALVLFVAVGCGSTDEPDPPKCTATCSGSINGVPYDLKCGESSECLSGERVTCKAGGAEKSSCTPGCACNTGAGCQSGCTCDPDCSSGTGKKWGDVCTCGAGYDGQSLFCSGTDAERCGMKPSDPDGSRWGCFWNKTNGYCTYKCATSGTECPSSAVCNSFPATTGTGAWKICAAP